MTPKIILIVNIGFIFLYLDLLELTIELNVKKQTKIKDKVIIQKVINIFILKIIKIQLNKFD